MNILDIKNRLDNENVSYIEENYGNDSSLEFSRNLEHVEFCFEIVSNSRTVWVRRIWIKVHGRIWGDIRDVQNDNLDFSTYALFDRLFRSIETSRWYKKYVRLIFTYEFQKFIGNLNPSLFLRIPSYALSKKILKEYSAYFELADINL